jgi:hypothetical protein
MLKLREKRRLSLPSRPGPSPHTPRRVYSIMDHGGLRTSSSSSSRALPSIPVQTDHNYNGQSDSRASSRSASPSIPFHLDDDNLWAQSSSVSPSTLVQFISNVERAHSSAAPRSPSLERVPTGPQHENAFSYVLPRPVSPPQFVDIEFPQALHPEAGHIYRQPTTTTPFTCKAPHTLSQSPPRHWSAPAAIRPPQLNSARHSNSNNNHAVQEEDEPLMGLWKGFADFWKSCAGSDRNS